MNPTISRALTAPAGTFYLEYDEGRGEVVLAYTAYNVSFDVNVLRIEGTPHVFADVAISQGSDVTHVFRTSAEAIQFGMLSYVGDTIKDVNFSVFLGYSDPTHPLYIDVTTFTGLLEYQFVSQPSHTVHYFATAHDLKTYLC